MRKASLIISVSMILAGCAAPSGDGARRAYRCAWTHQCIVVDGRLDDAAWAKATPVELLLTDTGEPPRQPTTVRALWSDTHLYVAFDSTDDDIWADCTDHDGDIYEHEVVEVFIDANSDRRSYLEIEVSPNNTVLDLYVLNPGGGARFTGMRDFETTGMETAVGLAGTLGAGRGSGPADDHRWITELAIPLDRLILAPHHPPVAGDRWRWNLYRIDRPADKRDEYTALCPTGAIAYHRPDQFGWLVFCR